MKTRKAIAAIKKSIESVNHGMFWDIIIDEGDIRERFCSEPEYYTDAEKAQSVISSLLMSHQDTLENAAREQCRRAEKDALEKLASIFKP